LNNSNFGNGSNSGNRISRDYLIDHNDVPRLIGKAGATIKQIQRENDVQIKVSNDRQSQWVDLMISGSNDQVINNAFNHIKSITGNIKEKNESSQSKSFVQPGIFFKYYSIIYLFVCLLF
jgi:polyribonucleotide nucleotidyltransferase